MNVIRIIGICCVLGLAGCYESKDKLFPDDGGVQMPLKSGHYGCYDDGELKDTFFVTEQVNNGKYLYLVRFEGPVDEGDVMRLAFHKIAGTRYIAVTHQNDNHIAKKELGIGLVNLNGSTLELLLMFTEHEIEIAKHTGGFTGSYKLAGTPEQQRAFIRAMAVEKPDEIVIACTFRK